MTRIGVIALTVVLAVALGVLVGQQTGGGADDKLSAVIARQSDGDQLKPCSELVGQPTTEVTDNGCADADGNLNLNATFSYDCPDGRKLSWNDTGWGYSDGVWQAHARADGQLVPPDADMAACNP
jgi:hypothetical protein